MSSSKYKFLFMNFFNLDESELPELTYQGIEAWDSVGHMSLITELEAQFDVEFDIDDIIDFSSFQKGKAILEKYGVQFD